MANTREGEFDPANVKEAWFDSANVEIGWFDEFYLEAPGGVTPPAFIAKMALLGVG